MPRAKSKVTISDDTQPEKLYVQREIPVDRFSTVRQLVEIKPSTCDVCGYDVTRSNKLPPYEEMDEMEQIKIREVLKKHKDIHTTTEKANVIKESDIPKRWKKKPRFA
jgi:hypothetical protein